MMIRNKKRVNLIVLISFIFIFLLPSNKKICFIFKAEIEFETDYGASDVDFSNGMFYISNPLLSQIQVYNEKGERLKIIGRKGEGPGEFGMYSPHAIIILGQRLLVNDPMRFRLQIFDLHGNFIRQYKYFTEIPLSPILRIYSFKGNEIGLYGYAIKEMKNGLISMVHKFIIFDIEKGTHKEIYSGFYGIVNPKDLKAFNPFSAYPLPSVTQDLIFQADREKYKIEVFDKKGEKVCEINKKSKAIPLSERLKKYFLEKEEFQKAKAASPVPVDFSFPSHLPIIKSILSLEKKLLVWTWESWYKNNFVRKKDKFYLDIFDSEGNYFGENSIPFNPEEVVKIKDNKIFILHSSDDKKIVRIYSLMKQPLNLTQSQRKG